MRRIATAPGRIRPSRDEELRDLFAGEPELLAIADAVHDSGRATRAPGVRRLALALVAVAILAAAPVSLALGDGVFGLFGFSAGVPATQAIRQEYVVFSGSLTDAVRSRFPLGLVDIRQARGVAEITTHAGPLYLWSAPEHGGGACYFLQFGALPLRESAVGDAGGCNPPTSPAARNITVGDYVPVFQPSERVVYGYTYADASSVRIDLAGAPAIIVPVAGRYFLAAIDARIQVRRIVAYDAKGREVGEAIPGYNPQT